MGTDQRGGFLCKGVFLTILALLAGILFTPCAHAHRVYLFAWVEGDLVHTQSYFGGNRPVRGGKIRVFDPQGREVLVGSTDDKGEFSFKPPPGGRPLRIVLEEAMGHRAEYMLGPEDGKQVLKESETGATKEPGNSEPKGTKSNQDQVRNVVKEVLRKELEPIKRSLARMEGERSPDFRDVLGGLGYIFGLMGVVLYLKSRKRGGKGKVS